MKKFSDLIKETALTNKVGPPDSDNLALDSGLLAFHEIEDSETLARLGTFVGALSDRDYTDPIIPLKRLQIKLIHVMQLWFDLPNGALAANGTMRPDDGTVWLLPMIQFGGRTGFLDNATGKVTKDDGLTHRTDTPLVMKITFGKNKSQRWTIDAEIVTTDRK